MESTIELVSYKNDDFFIYEKGYFLVVNDFCGDDIDQFLNGQKYSDIVNRNKGTDYEFSKKLYAQNAKKELEKMLAE